MLTSMIEVDDLYGAGKVLIGEIPDPDRAVADHHFLLGPSPATPPGFGIESETEGFGGLDGGDVGCGVLIAHGPALGVGRSLGENATQFHFPCACWLAVHLTGASLGLRF